MGEREVMGNAPGEYEFRCGKVTEIWGSVAERCLGLLLEVIGG
jgi:hypothetical protein